MNVCKTRQQCESAILQIPDFIAFSLWWDVFRDNIMYINKGMELYLGQKQETPSTVNTGCMVVL